MNICVGYAGSFNICRLFTFRAISETHISNAGAIFCNKSHNFVHCSVLHDLCMRSQCRRPNQLVLIASSICHLLNAYPIVIMAVFSMKKLTFLLFIEIFVLCCLISILTTLAFEMPIQNVHKFVTRHKRASNASNLRQNKQDYEKKIIWISGRKSMLETKPELFPLVQVYEFALRH